MAWEFDKDKTSKFKFRPNMDTATTFITLDGINSSVSSADVICDGVSSLMAIGSNDPTFYDAVRTSTEKVVDDE